MIKILTAEPFLKLLKIWNCDGSCGTIVIIFNVDDRLSSLTQWTPKVQFSCATYDKIYVSNVELKSLACMQDNKLY